MITSDKLKELRERMIHHKVRGERDGDEIYVELSPKELQELLDEIERLNDGIEALESAISWMDYNDE